MKRIIIALALFTTGCNLVENERRADIFAYYDNQKEQLREYYERQIAERDSMWRGRVLSLELRLATSDSAVEYWRRRWMACSSDSIRFHLVRPYMLSKTDSSAGGL